MSKLTTRERELVAIGAAVGCNCIPCIEFHIPVGRKTGITDEQLLEAVEFAENIKQVVSSKVRDHAVKMISGVPDPDASSCCGPGEQSKPGGNRCC